MTLEFDLFQKFQLLTLSNVYLSICKFLIFNFLTTIRAVTHRKKCNISISGNILKVKFCPLYVPQLEMLIMFLELLAAPPCPVGIHVKLYKFFTCRGIKVSDVKYFQ